MFRSLHLRLLPTLVFTTFLTSLGGPALGQDDYKPSDHYLTTEQALGLIMGVELVVDDQVQDQCWLNAETVKSKVRLIFEQNDIPVFDEDLFLSSIFTPTILIAANGLRSGTNGPCFGEVSTRVFTQEYSDYGGNQTTAKLYTLSYPALFFSESSVVFSGSNLNQLIGDIVEGQISDLVATIISQKRDPAVAEMRVLWAGMKDPITTSQFETMFNNATSSGVQ